jgi:hypothetical protein
MRTALNPDSRHDTTITSPDWHRFVLNAETMRNVAFLD